MSHPVPAIKKNDNVLVIAGGDRGLSVHPDKGRVVVEGVNVIKRHTKPNPQRNVKGGIVEREASLAVSNVQVVCPECGQPSRVGRRLQDDGRRVRYCVKCKGVVDK
jgi:large subunit ribosomal protein L24